MQTAFTLTFLEYACTVHVYRYRGNGRLAIELVDQADGEPVAAATVNLPGARLATDEVAIKNYAENEGLLEVLLSAGVVSPPDRFESSGFVTIPVRRDPGPMPPR